MRRPHLMAAIGLGAISVVLIAVSLSFYVERPTVLRVAVSSGDQDDVDLVGAAAKLAKHGSHGLRLKLVPTPDIQTAARALEQNEADVAVVRPDIAMPDKGETVVLLHKDVALLVAPGGGPVEKIGDLSGQRVGLVNARPEDTHLLQAALAQYDIAPEAVTTVALPPDGAEAALTGKQVSALFVVGQLASPVLQSTVRMVARVGEGPPVFLPIAEAAAIAERQPAYESVEVMKGVFGGLPPRPSDDIDTLGVTTRLVASADLSDETVAALTRFLLSERVALAELAPVARRMTAPATDKGAILPVHPGTAAYIDDDEETFLDRYSDFIYIGAMVLGVFASGLTAVIGRLGAVGAVSAEAMIGRLLGLLRSIRTAPAVAALDGYEAEVDAIVAEALEGAGRRGLDERKAAALAMAVDQVRTALHDRREALTRSTPSPANDDPSPAAALEAVRLTRKGLTERTGEL